MSDWKLAVSTEVLAARSSLYQQIRKFFFALDYLEVETPLLGKHTVSDLHLHSFKADNFYLQTSPEYAMKRLLASGQGSMFQICKSFRRGESGSRHQPEFSMLEWYAVGLDEMALIEQVKSLVSGLLACEQFAACSYKDAFVEALALNPHTAGIQQLEERLQQYCPELFADLFSAVSENTQLDAENSDQKDTDDLLNDSAQQLEEALQRNTLLELLFANVVEPGFDPEVATFVYDWPQSQSALARISKDTEGQLVAKRFELYYKGFELANAYYECNSSVELRKRFNEQNKLRQQQGLAVMDLDEAFIESQDHLPECSGIALGLDRLLMIQLGLDDIRDVMALPY